MYAKQTHQMSPDLGTMEIFCNRCGETVAHDLEVTTDNRVERRMSGKYVDTARVVGIVAVCAEDHSQTIFDLSSIEDPWGPPRGLSRPRF